MDVKVIFVRSKSMHDNAFYSIILYLTYSKKIAVYFNSFLRFIS